MVFLNIENTEQNCWLCTVRGSSDLHEPSCPTKKVGLFWASCSDTIIYPCAKTNVRFAWPSKQKGSGGVCVHNVLGEAPLVSEGQIILPHYWAISVFIFRFKCICPRLLASLPSPSLLLTTHYNCKMVQLWSCLHRKAKAFLFFWIRITTWGLNVL